MSTPVFPLDDAVVLFLTLVALYSPVAALSSYVPLVATFSARDQTRLAVTLFVYVAAIALTAIWVGEFLLGKVLGISTDALVVTGGVALILEAST